MLSELFLRLARPDDRPDMERICATTWEWGDYIPEVWDAWLAEQERALAGELGGTGVVLVGEWHGRTVALSRIRHQTPEEFWLEAMRVDPETRQCGIAGRFLEHSLAYAHEKGARVARLGTGEHNAPVHTITARTGMERVGSYVLWKAEPLPDFPRPFVLKPEASSQIWAFLEASPVLAHTKGLYSVEWTWQELTPQCVAQHLAQGEVVAGLGADGQLLALVMCHLNREDRDLWVGFADGEARVVEQLAREVRAHAAQAGADRIRIMLPDVSWLRESWSTAGYLPGDWEGELIIYERRLRDAVSEQALSVRGQHGD